MVRLADLLLTQRVNDFEKLGTVCESLPFLAVDFYETAKVGPAAH